MQHHEQHCSSPLIPQKRNYFGLVSYMSVSGPSQLFTCMTAVTLVKPILLRMLHNKALQAGACLSVNLMTLLTLRQPPSPPPLDPPITCICAAAAASAGAAARNRGPQESEHMVSSPQRAPQLEAESDSAQASAPSQCQASCLRQGAPVPKATGGPYRGAGGPMGRPPFIHPRCLRPGSVPKATVCSPGQPANR